MSATDHSPDAAVVGAGPAGLMAAERLAAAGFRVVVCDRMASPARKLLMAGRGGLNLSHSESTDRLIERYGPAADRLEPAIRTFSTEALREWCDGLGVGTFVGSSGRVFPTRMKASPLLRAWLRRLDALGVAIRPRLTWRGFSGTSGLAFDGPDGVETITPGVAVLALGGASWPRLGADGGWTVPFTEAGVGIAPLAPANCGFTATWSPTFKARFAGSPLKRVALTFEGRVARGEAVVTAGGIEGGLIYLFSRALRRAIERDGEARPSLDLRPDLALDALAQRLAAPRGKRSLSTHLARTASLPPPAVALLREAGELPSDPRALAGRIKAVPLLLTGATGLDRAISTAGGVLLDEVDDDFMLKRRPGTHVVGEMLDWEAPTGGYLLHACLATGRLAGDAAARRLAQGAGGRAPILERTSRGTPS